MSPLVLGVDVGGTKTHACLATTDGTVVATASGGAGNWEGVGLPAVEGLLEGLVAEVTARAGARRADVGAATFALAGLDWPSDEQRLRPVVETLGLAGPHLLVNDAFAALRAGTEHPYGLVNNAGTGGVSAGRNRAGRVFRTMAVGIGEGNGSSDLAHRALWEVAREVHGQVPATSLTAAFLEATGHDTAVAMFEDITRGGLEIHSGHAPLVLDAAEVGDPAAIGVVRAVAEQHAADVVGVARVLGMLADDVDVVLAGSVHSRGVAAWRDRFAEVVLTSMPGAVLRPLHAPAVVGAVLLAVEALDVDGELVAGRLAEQAGRELHTLPARAG